MQYQIAWSNWWKIWPYYSTSINLTKEETFTKYEVWTSVFCFGIFQFRWHSTKEA